MTTPNCRRPRPDSDTDVDDAIRIASYVTRWMPLDVRDDAYRESLASWTASRQRWDPQGGKLTTFAYERMRGSAVDLLRRESRVDLRRARPVHSGDVVVASKTTVKLALAQALERARGELDSAELVVLNHVYGQDQTIKGAADLCGKSEDIMQRANARLLARLRDYLSVDVR